MSSERWLYPKALQIVQEYHDCTFSLWKGRLTITQKEIIGTSYIQIDVLAINHQSNCLLIIECKDFLSIQALIECAAQLKMKCYLLRHYVSFPIMNLSQKSDLDRYKVLQYICIGSHSGRYYTVAKYNPSTFQRRIDFFKNHLDTTVDVDIGLIAIGDDDHVCFKRANPMVII
jgi:hypothetical protein